SAMARSWPEPVGTANRSSLRRPWSVLPRSTAPSPHSGNKPTQSVESFTICGYYCGKGVTNEGRGDGLETPVLGRITDGRTGQHDRAGVRGSGRGPGRSAGYRAGGDAQAERRTPVSPERRGEGTDHEPVRVFRGGAGGIPGGVAGGLLPERHPLDARFHQADRRTAGGQRGRGREGMGARARGR